MDDVIYLDISKKSINDLVSDLIIKKAPAPTSAYFDIVSDFIKKLTLHVSANGISKDIDNFFFQEDIPEAYKLFSTMLHWQVYVDVNHPKFDIDLTSILKQWNSKFYTECMKSMYAPHDYFKDVSFN